jgi:CSLREA domain-containing protein
MVSRLTQRSLLLLLVLAACTPEQPPTAPGSNGPLFSVQSDAAHPVVNTNADHDDGSCDVLNNSVTPAEDCTLREAIAFASAGGTITFAVSGPITLSTTYLLISKDLTITGPAGGITIRRSSTDPAFGILVVTSAIQNSPTVQLTNLIISGGSDPFGAGIANSGTLTLTNCTVTGNSATGSGASGGGISNAGPLTLINSTVSGNSAPIGAGIANGHAQLTLTRSTVSGNTASDVGGGIFLHGGPVTITNSTISGNTSGAQGGGIYNDDQLTLTNSTISGNTATDGGGLFNAFSATLLNTIVAGNTGTSPDLASSGFAALTASYSLIGSSAGHSITTDPATGNKVGVDPKLGALADNGGPTKTHALLAGSPAIDAATNTGCPATDQRGVTRPQPAGGVCDIGAFEAQPSDLINQLKQSVAGLGLPSGTANSLLSKLDDAIKLANAGKVKAACSSLQDFINAVMAQSGKKISPSDASALIAAANSIRSLLGC